MPVIAVRPALDISTFLPQAQFADAFSITIDGASLDARTAAQKMFERSPRWAGALMTTRDAIVGPLGLKTERMARVAIDRVGMFPVISETPSRIVAGLNDRHLDFRVVVDVATVGSQQRITATTIVHTHNLLGRAYLATIMPFHRLIVPAMLRQVAAQSVPETSARK